MEDKIVKEEEIKVTKKDVICMVIGLLMLLGFLVVAFSNIRTNAEITRVRQNEMLYEELTEERTELVQKLGEIDENTCALEEFVLMRDAAAFNERVQEGRSHPFARFDWYSVELIAVDRKN